LYIPADPGGVPLDVMSANPFRPSFGTTPPRLAGRDDIVAHFADGLDEVHAADTDDLRELTTVIQHCFREDHSVAFAAAGLPAAVGVRLLDDDVLTFLRRAERFELGAVGRIDVREAILIPVRAAGRDIAADALEAAVTASSGYPFLIQLVGYHIWRVEPDAPTITADHVATAIPAVEERLGRLVVEPAVSSLSDRDHDFLDAMAVDDGPSRVRDIAARMGVSGNYVNRYRRRLLDAELITEAGRGRIDLQLPGAREWLRERSAPAFA
jgi:hypothetical protein